MVAVKRQTKISLAQFGLKYAEKRRTLKSRVQSHRPHFGATIAAGASSALER